MIMDDTGQSRVLAPLILDLLEWLTTGPKPYSEVMEAWRTSCPRLTVWEDAHDNGFVVETRASGEEWLVDLTPLGRSFLEASGRTRPEPGVAKSGDAARRSACATS